MGVPRKNPGSYPAQYIKMCHTPGVYSFPDRSTAIKVRRHLYNVRASLLETPSFDVVVMLRAQAMKYVLDGSNVNVSINRDAVLDY